MFLKREQLGVTGGSVQRLSPLFLRQRAPLLDPACVQGERSQADRFPQVTGDGSQDGFLCLSSFIFTIYPLPTPLFHVNNTISIKNTKMGNFQAAAECSNLIRENTKGLFESVRLIRIPSE